MVLLFGYSSTLLIGADVFACWNIEQLNIWLLGIRWEVIFLIFFDLKDSRSWPFCVPLDCRLKNKQINQPTLNMPGSPHFPSTLQQTNKTKQTKRKKKKTTTKNRKKKKLAWLSKQIVSWMTCAGITMLSTSSPVHSKYIFSFDYPYNIYCL